MEKRLTAVKFSANNGPDAQRVTKRDSQSPYAIVLAIAGLPRSPNAIRGHWAANAKRIKAWRAAVVRAVELNGGPPPRPLEHAKIKFTRYSSVEPDHDNSVAACKPLLDGLRDAGVIVDDRKRNVGAPVYAWEKAPPKRGRVVIEVREVTPIPPKGGSPDSEAAP